MMMRSIGLLFLFLSLFGAVWAQTCPTPPVTISLTDYRSLTTMAGGISSGRTYVSANLGVPAMDRSIIVADGFRDAGTCPLASMTIGGVAAKRVAQKIDSQTYTTIASLWIAQIPSGASADIVTTYCANVDSAEAIGVYAVYGLTSTTPVATGGSNSITNPVINLAASSGGVGVALAWGLGQTASFTWYGGNADYAILTDPTSTSQYQFGASTQNTGSNFVFSGVYGAASTYEPVSVAATFR